MGLFSPRTPKPPQIRIIKQSDRSRVLDFSEFMDDSMKRRTRSGTLDFMDKVTIFEDFYIPTRESEGWVAINGGRNDGDRFNVTWQVADQVLIGSYNDLEFTVTERVKKTK